MNRLHSAVLVCVALAIGGITLANCGSGSNNAGVIVTYKQQANFPDYRISADSSDSTGAAGMFVMYKITQIVNTSAAKSFVFDVHDVSTVVPDQTSNVTVDDVGSLLVDKGVDTVTVKPGKTLTLNRCFIKDALTKNQKALVAAHVSLIYKKNDKQPAAMFNQDPNNGLAIVGNALPITLQSLCTAT